MRLPDAPDRTHAESSARMLHGEELLEVVSVADREVAEDERAARARNRRLRLLNNDDDQDGA